MTLSHVSKSYDGKPVLRDLSFSLPDRGLTLIVAPSGYGKTTLLRLLAGLEKPDSGELPDVGRVSVLFQEDRLFPHLSALDNLTVVLPKGQEERAQRLLAAVGLSEDGHKYPSQLSGGMNRRVAIARALAVEADTYLLDEPFKGLDEERKKAMVDLVLSETAGKRVIVVTHEPSDFAGQTAVVLDLAKENC